MQYIRWTLNYMPGGAGSVATSTNLLGFPSHHANKFNTIGTPKAMEDPPSPPTRGPLNSICWEATETDL